MKLACPIEVSFEPIHIIWLCVLYISLLLSSCGIYIITNIYDLGWGSIFCNFDESSQQLLEYTSQNPICTKRKVHMNFKAPKTSQKKKEKASTCSTHAEDHEPNRKKFRTPKGVFSFFCWDSDFNWESKFLDLKTLDSALYLSLSPSLWSIPEFLRVCCRFIEPIVDVFLHHNG